MAKRLILFLLIFYFAFISVRPAYADDFLENEPVTDFQTEETAEPVNQKLPVVEASAAIVMDMESGRILYEKDAYTRRPMASTTKIMTAILAIENGNPDDIVTVSRKAASIWGSTIGLKEGEMLTLRELLMGMMINSGNDAAIAVAEYIGGTLENFLGMMNEKAKELGADNTSFKSPHGLDATDHYTTAYDLAEITRYALKNETFSGIVAMRQAQIKGMGLYNTNEMLDLYPGADGVKTGYTGQAGRCLVTSVTRDGRRLISVVLNSPTRSARARSSKNILDFAFSNYKPYTLMSAGNEVVRLKVKKGITAEIPLIAVDEIKLPMNEAEIRMLEKIYSYPQTIEAPVEAGMIAGCVKFMLNGKEIARTAVVTGARSLRKDFSYYLRGIFGNWIKLVRVN